MTRPEHEQTLALIDNIEQELKRLDIWESSPPQPDAMDSPNPFCYDTLEIHQWLQWVFIPRIRALSDAGQKLPAQCDIASYAEVVFEAHLEDRVQLIEHIRAFDKYCSSSN